MISDLDGFPLWVLSLALTAMVVSALFFPGGVQ